MRNKSTRIPDTVMPILIALGVAYAAYVKANAGDDKNQDQTFEVDPSIQLDGKDTVALLDIEREFAAFELPVASITFYDGSYKEAAALLATRVDKIMQASPWIGGWLLPDPNDKGRVKIVYDPDGCQVAPGQFQVFDGPNAIPVTRKTSYSEIGINLSSAGALVPNNQELIGQNKALWKVAVIPDKDQPEERFAVVVSMSHMIGDAHTYYKLFQMLGKNAEVELLNPIRQENYRAAVDKTLGKREANYMKSLMERPEKKQDTEKAPDKSSEKTVVKLFYLNDHFVAEPKMRRVSVFDNDPTPATADVTASVMVSANSMITSWFFKMNQASIGMVMMNLRNKLESCPIDDSDAGNYVHAVLLAPQDYATASKCNPGYSQSHSSPL